jgi:hypothetical protein
VRGDGHITLYLDSPLRPTAPALDCPGIEVVLAPDLTGEVEAALDRMRNQSMGAAPQRLLPRRIALRAGELKITDETGFVDRLLMRKLDGEIDAIRRSAKLADEATRCSCRRCGPAAPTMSWWPSARRSSAPTASTTTSRSSASAASR